MRRVRPARHYQHPDAPVRRIADHAIPGVARAFKRSLRVAARLFDPKEAEHLLHMGRYREVADLINWGHHDEAMRRPLAMLGNLWLDGGGIGERRLNGAFTQRRRVVRYKKRAATEERLGDGPATAHWRAAHEAATAILDQDAFLAKVVIAKDQADLFNYDRFDPVTQTRIRAFQDALITQLGEDSRAAIEETILNAMRRGAGPESIVADIRRVIGLTDRQAAAVLRYRDMLTGMDSGVLSRSLASGSDKAEFRAARAAGTGLSPEAIDRMVGAYEENYLNSRALSIATTEATRAASLGLQDSYLQAVDRGVLPAEAVRQYWQISLDEKTCDHCLSVVDMNEGGVPLGEPFQSDDGDVDGPPYHPNCRCSLELITNLDLVPDDAEI